MKEGSKEYILMLFSNTIIRTMFFGLIYHNSLNSQTDLATCISIIDKTTTTKKRQTITGVRQKASTANSSITTTLMD
jgi:hypothetical protein